MVLEILKNVKFSHVRITEFTVITFVSTCAEYVFARWAGHLLCFILQNLAEAEYAVSLFMFMRLQGYPPKKITILTTYNGQKHLIRDVLAKRCAVNPVFGLPEKVCNS